MVARPLSTPDEESPSPSAGGGGVDDPLLSPLNPPQRDAVRHIDGPLLVLAGPGSGKTRVITHRIAYLVRSGVGPQNILAITFTNKAAGEMRERVARLLGVSSSWISTFHSFAARVLRRHIFRLTPFTTDFSIYDADDALGLIKECLKALDVSSHLITPRALQQEISRLKNRGVEDPEALPPSMDLRERIVRQVFARYVKGLAERNALDFDDLLLFLLRLLQTQPDILQYYGKQFRHVLIDEYQDTNMPQYRIGKLIAAEHHNICVTGDPDQAIYSWRGADLRNILTFENDFPEARVIRLEQNYRSTRAILDVANAAIAGNKERKAKTLWTQNAQGEPVRVYGFGTSDEESIEIAGLIERFRHEGRPLSDFAVFYRINALSREIEQALLMNGIPYTIVGAIEFYSRKEIKDLLAYLRLLVNPRDIEALKRIINVPARGIGRVAQDRLFAAAASQGVSPLDALRLPDVADGGRRGGRKPLRAFADLAQRLAELPRNPVAELLRRVISLTGYGEHLRAFGSEEAAERLANVEELVNAAAQFDERRGAEGDVGGFLEEVALMTGLDRWEDTRDRVTLMTLHSAKGLEFPIVILSGVEQGLLPLMRADADDDIDIEEERRLFFVGVTRAKEKLYLTHSSMRRRFGNQIPARPSSFLEEILAGAGAESLEADAETRAAIARWQRTRSLYDADDFVVADAGVPRGARAAAARLNDDDLDDADAPGDDDAWEDDFVDIDPFPVGQRVHHDEFGAGTVTGARGRGKLRRLTIEFDGGPRKQIVPGYAPLRRLDG